VSGPPVANRWLESLPMYLSLLVTMAALFLRPRYPIVDRWRLYLITGTVTVLVWLLAGYLLVHFVGGKRPAMVLVAFCAMPAWPVPIWVLIASLNAGLDQSRAAEMNLRVAGFSYGRGRKLVGVRFESPGMPFPEVEAGLSFVGPPTPDVGDIFRATSRAGAFGVRWIPTLQRTTTAGRRKDEMK